jgi:tRNA pseudouridine38-40 synthase
VRYFCRISYNGSTYFGWQKQANTDNTIQSKIEKCFSTLLREPIDIVGCGRTDTGVHAKDYWFHFDIEGEIEVKQIIYKSNLILPTSISINEIVQVSNDLHARFHAEERSYIYRIKSYKDPFDFFHFYYPHIKLDHLPFLNEISDLIKKAKDFSCYCKSHASNKTNICEIKSCTWSYNESDHTFEFKITANRFIRGQIRMLVGMCLQALNNKVNINQIRDSLFDNIPLVSAFSVDAIGLTLYDIKYHFNKESKSSSSD